MTTLNHSKLNSLVVFLLGLIFFLYVAVSVMSGGVSQLTFYGGIIAGLTWVVLGQKAWWMPIPLAAIFGGLVWVGFRVYTHELAVAMAFAALIPALILDRRSYLQTQRPPVPKTAWLLFIYLLMHLGASWLMAGGSDFKGSIIRTYANALWPVIFFIYYLKYGSSKKIMTLLTIIYVLLIMRCSLGIYTYFFPQLVYFRGGSFLFVLSQYGSLDLRGPSLQLMAIALSLAIRPQSASSRAFHVIVAGIAFWLLLLGSSRAGFVMAIVVPIIITLVQRRFLIGLTIVFFITVIIVALKSNPELVNALPTQAQRALSVVVFGKNSNIYATIEGSDEWHAYLSKTGWENWTESLNTLLIGNRVHPYDDYFLSNTADMFSRADIAAKTTRYEKMLWTVLATLGLTGAFFYVSIYFRLFKGPFRQLVQQPIRTKTDVVYLIALIQVSLALLFAPFVGTFPSFELVWGALALGLYYDQRAQADAQKTQPLKASKADVK